MPPKSRITGEMIVNAAFDIVKEQGAESLSARSIAVRLNCSTQPVLYCFKTVDEVRAEVYATANRYHDEYLMKGIEKAANPMYAIGLNYIRFGYEEKNLFKFLFQSGNLSGKIEELFNDEALEPVLATLQARTGCDREKTKLIFKSIYYSVHGIASLLANNALEYNEEHFKDTVVAVYNGVVNEVR